MPRATGRKYKRNVKRKAMKEHETAALEKNETGRNDWTLETKRERMKSGRAIGTQKILVEKEN